MKKIVKIITAGLAIALLASCSMTLPVATSDAPIGSKKGVSETSVLFGVIEFNKNYGVSEAVKNGKIKGGVATVDEKTTTFLSYIFFKKQLIVTGE